jgi:hypothetical protein
MPGKSHEGCKNQCMGGQHGLGGQIQNLIFSCKSGLTIIFGVLNDLRNKSYINLYKSYEGCKN